MLDWGPGGGGGGRFMVKSPGCSHSSLDSVLSGHVGSLTTAYCDSSFTQSDASAFCGHMAYTYTDTYTYNKMIDV